MFPAACPADPRMVQADLGEGHRPGLRHADRGSRRRPGLEPQCLPHGGRQARSIGERREDRDFLRPVLARLVVTQLDLMQAGQASHLRLSKAVLLKDRDDVAQIPLRACVEDVLLPQTRSTILRTSEIGRTTARFPFPWSLASR